MKGKLWNPVVLAAGIIASSVAASDETPMPCLAGMRAALVRGHFTGPIVCSRKDASFILIGRTTGSKFSIYDYRYKFLPAQGAVMHGGQRMVVFSGNLYIGQYSFSPPPYVTVTVNGTDVLLKTADKPKIELDLTVEPPSHILFDGEVQTFSR